MTSSHHRAHLSRRLIISFSFLLIPAIYRMIKQSLFDPSSEAKISYVLAEIYSKLWDFAERSISHDGFDLPTALGSGSTHHVNDLLKTIYGGRFASLSFGGSSGAMLTILTAVLPKMQKNRDIILFDDVCHQSTIGGIIFGRWKAVRIPREYDTTHQTTRPLDFERVRDIIDLNDPSKIAAIILVSPSYGGFGSPAENQKIYTYAKALGIFVIIDGAWDSVRFQEKESIAPRLDSVSDVWISSPHKRGLTPSSLGCIITSNETIATLWDAALDLGFRSSSISFVEIMIAEHRLQQIIDGQWDMAFSKAKEAANLLRAQITDIHPSLFCVEAKDVHAEVVDPTHLLINTHRIRGLDARLWAKALSSDFGLDVEKSTPTTLLLICASPAHAEHLSEIKFVLKKSLEMTLQKSLGKS